MAPHATPTDTKWSVEFDTLRREHLFRHPPKDHTPYPALQEAIRPHVESFNGLLEADGLIEQGLRDIGTKVFLDGQPGDSARNRLSVRVKETFWDKAQLPPSNKFSTRNREIYPAECRERHCSYRGKMRVRLEYRINGGDWFEVMREIGQVPIMLKVSTCKALN